MSTRRPQPSWSGEPARSGDSCGNDWYAVTEDGDSALRVTQGLTLGERDGGELALNAGAAEACWVAFDLSGAEGVVVACPAGRLLDGSGEPLERLALEPGLCLDLPNNRVRISRSIRSSAADGPVVSVRAAEAAPPAAAPAASPVPAASGGPESAAAPQARLSGRDRPARAGLPVARSGLMAAAALGLLVLVALAALRPGSTSRTGTEETGPAPVASPPAARRPPPDLVRLPPVAPRLLAAPVAPVDPAAGPAPAAQREAAAAPDDPRLARAEALIEAGRITYPPGDNAVDLLTAVLRDHPGHPGAMNLLGRCTTRLLDDARAARAAGLDYQARNLLEELLGFNPGHPEARALWAEWVGTPR